VRDFAHRVGNPPVYLNPDDYVLWDMTYDSYRPDGEISDGDTWNVAGIRLKALHTPGHSPGSTCFFVETGLPAPVSAGAGRAVGPVLFSGDTLFSGGPGATGRSHSSFETIIESIRDVLFELPEATVVLTGHGDSTSIGAERPSLEGWIKRGYWLRALPPDACEVRRNSMQAEGAGRMDGRGSQPLCRLRPASACSADDG